jgi:hypothetical protein
MLMATAGLIMAGAIVLLNSAYWCVQWVKKQLQENENDI